MKRTKAGRVGWMKWVALVGLVLGASAAWAAPGGLAGNWVTDDGSVVKVAPCGSEICLTVIKVTPTAPATTDAQNPDANLRARPLCGLRIGFGFKAEGENAASGGRLYDPKSGRTYNGKFELKGDTLHLRGYVGVALFGRSEVWTRAGEVGSCRV